MQFEEAGNYITNKLSNELAASLHYHNVKHTKDVFSACERLAEMENIDTADKQLLLTAAWYHDSGFLKLTTGHELVSCQIARENLPAYGYTAAEVDDICRIIMATRVPQEPGSHLEEMIADADLDYLGRDDFFVLSSQLYAELVALGAVGSQEEWDRQQVDFLERHHYFTESAQQLRGQKKETHLTQLKARLIHK